MVQNNNIRAAVLIMLAMSMITTNDAIVKHLTQAFGVGQIMFIRGILVCAIFSVVLTLTKTPIFSRHAFHRWDALPPGVRTPARKRIARGLVLVVTNCADAEVG